MNRRIIPIGTYVDYAQNFWQVTGSCVMGPEQPMERFYWLCDADGDEELVSAPRLEDAAVATAAHQGYIRLSDEGLP
jgi:hypothetical protein